MTTATKIDRETTLRSPDGIAGSLPPQQTPAQLNSHTTIGPDWHWQMIDEAAYYRGLWCKLIADARKGFVIGSPHCAEGTEFQTAGTLVSLMRSLLSLNCPFRMRRISSIPAMVIAALRNTLKPSIAPYAQDDHFTIEMPTVEQLVHA